MERAATRVRLESLGDNIASPLNLELPKSVANAFGRAFPTSTTTICTYESSEF